MGTNLVEANARLKYYIYTMRFSDIHASRLVKGKGKTGDVTSINQDTRLSKKRPCHPGSSDPLNLNNLAQYLGSCTPQGRN